jgi:hypothetical protein
MTATKQEQYNPKKFLVEAGVVAASVAVIQFLCIPVWQRILIYSEQKGAEEIDR